MSSIFEATDLLTIFIFLGTFISGLLLTCAFFMKISNGLFFSRTIEQYKKDQYDPRFEKEQNIGKTFTRITFKYVPPFFTSFLILLILKFLKLL